MSIVHREIIESAANADLRLTLRQILFFHCPRGGTNGADTSSVTRYPWIKLVPDAALFHRESNSSGGTGSPLAVLQNRIVDFLRGQIRQVLPQ